MAHQAGKRPAIDPVRRRLAPAPPSSPPRPESFPAARFIPVSGHGPEDVVTDRQGRLLCGVADGRILRVDPRDGSETAVADTGGRPLGLEQLPDGRVLVCDSHRGLLRIDPETAEVETLVAEVDGDPLRLCSNAAAAADGTIWFTESTNRFSVEWYRAALFEQRGAGRLFRRDPDGGVETVLSGLYFANGVALTDDEQAVVFAETADYRVSKLWIAGPKAGQRETLLGDLAGFPDNMSRLHDGRLWVAIASPRDKVADLATRLHPALRKATWRLPERLQPQAKATTWVIGVDPAGDVVAEFHADRPDYRFVTGAAEVDGHLYLSSLETDGLLELTLP
jgi:sugar lactone lactonase YvrE